MRDLPLPRRAIVGGLAASALTGVLPARAALPPLPKSPVAISIIDVAGALALHQRAFEDYRAAHRRRRNWRARSRRSSMPGARISTWC
jgi:putative spermidine/putrescine transport system substrate-binding protein